MDQSAVQHAPVQEWIVDNYDGQESYEELGVSITAQHWLEKPLEPEMFHQMTGHMTAIEGEIDEALRDTIMSNNKRREEWRKLRGSVLQEAMGNNAADQFKIHITRRLGSTTVIRKPAATALEEAKSMVWMSREDRARRGIVVKLRMESIGGQMAIKCVSQWVNHIQ